PTILDRGVAALDEASFLQAPVEAGDEMRERTGRRGAEKSHHRCRCLLLGARTKRPCSCAAEDTEKFPPPHGSNPRHGNAGIISPGKSLIGITTYVRSGSKAHIARLAAQRGRPMSALGQQQIKRHQAALSALPPKADKERTPRYVRFVPQADK